MSPAVCGWKTGVCNESVPTSRPGGDGHHTADQSAPVSRQPARRRWVITLVRERPHVTSTGRAATGHRAVDCIMGPDPSRRRRLALGRPARPPCCVSACLGRRKHLLIHNLVTKSARGARFRYSSHSAIGRNVEA